MRFSTPLVVKLNCFEVGYNELKITPNHCSSPQSRSLFFYQIRMILLQIISHKHIVFMLLFSSYSYFIYLLPKITHHCYLLCQSLETAVSALSFWLLSFLTVSFSQPARHYSFGCHSFHRIGAPSS